jgi:Kef-type K+ transport system membrane component KefB
MEKLTLQVLLGIGIVIACSTAVAPLFARLRQPAVVGQIAVGLAFGLLPKRVLGVIFPTAAIPSINVVAQVGLVLFMFTIGYELPLGMLRRHARTSVASAGGAFALPMLLGAGMAILLIGTPLGGVASVAHRVPFVLFVAVAMSITAVPVLAWILRDRKMQSTPVGVVALASASIMDIAGWLVLALSIALLSASVHSMVTIAILLPVYVAAMIWVVRPALRRWMRPSQSVSTRAFLLIALTMGSAWVTGQLGLHVIFGALLIGVLAPRKENGNADPQLLQWMSRAGSALLPVFFAVTGLTVNVSGLGGTDWGIFVGVCAIAIAGKIGGGWLTARASRLPNKVSVTIGVLLNTRGLTELIALNAGYQVGLIDRNLYTILVLMAVTTTALTGPLLTKLGYAKPLTSVTHDDEPAPVVEIEAVEAEAA